MKNGSGYLIDFNLCDNISTECGTSSLVVNKKQCILYSGNWSQDKLWTLDTKDQLTLIFPSGDKCPKGGNYNIKMTLICDKSTLFPQILNPGSFDQTNCENKIIMKSKHGILLNQN